MTFAEYRKQYARQHEWRDRAFAEAQAAAARVDRLLLDCEIRSGAIDTGCDDATEANPCPGATLAPALEFHPHGRRLAASLDKELEQFGEIRSILLGGPRMGDVPDYFAATEYFNTLAQRLERVLKFVVPMVHRAVRTWDRDQHRATRPARVYRHPVRGRRRHRQRIVRRASGSRGDPPDEPDEEPDRQLVAPCGPASRSWVTPLEETTSRNDHDLLEPLARGSVTLPRRGVLE